MTDRPLYWPHEKPAGMETRAGLAAMRRRLVDGQQPVAVLRYGCHATRTHLYRVDDTIPLPPRTIAQHAADRRRRSCRDCERCGVDTLGIELSRYGDQWLCGDCAHEEIVARIAEHRPRSRRESADWAAGVIADPTAVVVDVTTVQVRQPSGVYTVKTEAVRCVAIASAAADTAPSWWYIQPQERPQRMRDLPAGVPGCPPDSVGHHITVVAAEISDQLLGKRIVAWRRDPVTRLLDRDLLHAICGYRGASTGEWERWPRGRRRLHTGTADALHDRYAEWVGRPELGSGIGCGWAGQRRPRIDPPDRVLWMRDLITRMASTPARGDST